MVVAPVVIFVVVAVTVPAVLMVFIFALIDWNRNFNSLRGRSSFQRASAPGPSGTGTC